MPQKKARRNAAGSVPLIFQRTLNQAPRARRIRQAAAARPSPASIAVAGSGTAEGVDCGTPRFSVGFWSKTSAFVFEVEPGVSKAPVSEPPGNCPLVELCVYGCALHWFGPIFAVGNANALALNPNTRAVTAKVAIQFMEPYGCSLLCCLLISIIVHPPLQGMILLYIHQ